MDHKVSVARKHLETFAYRKLLIAFILSMITLQLGQATQMFVALAAPTASFSYSNTTSGTIPDVSCSGTGLTRTFNVVDDFTINDLNVGVKITHTSRRHLVLSIESPNGTNVELHNGVLQGPYAHIDATFDQSATTEASTDTAAHNTAAPDYDVQWNPGSGSLNSFNGEEAMGTWTLSVCDKQSTNTGTFTSARLDFDGTPAVTANPGEILGTVFRDYDNDGILDGSEPGIGNVTVTAVDSSGTSTSTTTATDGTYTIPASAGLSGDVRVEFTLPTDNSLDFLKSGAAGGTTVQFVNVTSGVSDVDAAFQNPADYCQTAADLITSCYVLGDNSGTEDVLVSLDFNAPTGMAHEAVANQIGTTYGLAYQRSSDSLFAAAYHKRFAGFVSSPGSIFIVSNPDDGVTTASEFVNLNTLFGSNVAGTDVHDFVTTNTGGDIVDAPAYAVTTRTSFGDMDIAEDELSLWVINLANRSLYNIPLGSDPAAPVAPTSSSQVTVIPLTGGVLTGLPAGITTDEIRPFAVKVKDGLVYIGLVTNGEDGGSLNALAYSYDPDTTTFTKVLEFPLNYARGCGLAYDPGSGQQCFGPAAWNAWVDTYPASPALSAGSEEAHPQPIFADIEFDAAGNMLIGLRDRFGDQTGYEAPLPASIETLRTGDAFGDILRATPNGSGGWTMTISDFTDSTLSNFNNIQTEPFFGGDDYTGSSQDLHEETAMGGLAILLRQNDVATTVLDPDIAFTSGVDWFDSQSGSLTDSFQIVDAGLLFAKANGLGELELICNAAPIEIGNRIWRDSDGDGIQDPGEDGISGVQVQLYNSSNGLISTVTTDANGNYLFSSDPAGADSGHADYNLTQLTASTSGFEVRVGTAQGALSGLVLTAVNTNDGSNSDLHDSDAALSGSSAIVTVDTGVAGSNNHTFDIGFAEADYGDLPDTFDTTSSNNGPSHGMSSTLYLGSCVDSESNGAPDAAAGTDGSGGDDNTAGSSTFGSCSIANDDEDGVTLITPLIPNNEACVEVDAVNSTGSTATLQGWIDFNGDGDFDGDANEALIFTSGGTIANGGATNQQACFTVPSSATFDGGETHMRFRLSSSGGLSFNGAASDGEVEDYYQQLACVGNYVWNDTTGTTANVQDGSDTAVSGATVRLVWAGVDNTLDTSGSNGTAQNDDRIYTTITNGSGVYNFCGLIPDASDTYRLDMPTPPTGLETAVSPNQGDDNSDSDGSQSGTGGPVSSPTFTISSPINLPTGENGNQDNPGTLNNFPDAQDQINFDFGFLAEQTGAIGNYIWVDENSDGYQDPGEPGIPNVTVNLYDGSGTLVATTVTDSHGGYLFTGLPANTYYVDVADGTGGTSNSLPNGLTQTTPSTLAGSDFGNQDHATTAVPGGGGLTGYQIVLAAGTENLTADFGYNYNPTTDVNSPTGSPTAALGDRVWVDSDGDGHQDPNEIGVSGVTVTLTNPGADGLFGTADDTTQTTTTDDNGYYLFDSLIPGAYTVTITDSGSASHDVLGGSYTQTGDPDHFGTTGNNNDNTTTMPVVLGPGDVFLNADFGYQPTAVTLGSIGDTIFFDADADGNGPALAPVDGGAPITQGAGGAADSSDYGIPSVTVALIRDSNGNGIWDSGEPIIATDTTDSNGQYLFAGLPLTDGAGSDDYLVWVNDTDHVLGEMAPTYDADGSSPASGFVTGLGISAVTDLAGDVRNQDFGYTASGHSSGSGLIGDTIWFDLDGSGGNQSTQGSEPGIEGVTLTLTDGLGNSWTTATDENGRYSFGNLPLNQTYTVVVDASNFASGGVLEGMSLTYDPDGATPANTGTAVTLTAGSPINLDQDFSYTGSSGKIGNLVWLDPDADGSYDSSSETPIGNVTVDLYRDLNCDGTLGSGEGLFGQMTTAAAINAGLYGSDGNYIFENLPVVGAGSGGGACFIVDVSDENGELAGYWHSLGTPNSNNQSQVDPYGSLELTAAVPNIRTADFGYYFVPGELGNRVWLDNVNQNGLQDVGEAGVNGITITLSIDYGNGNTPIVLRTVTRNDPATGEAGWYTFGNLLLDEDYNGDGSGSEPIYTVSANTTGYELTTVDVGSNGSDNLDADDPAGVTTGGSDPNGPTQGDSTGTPLGDTSGNNSGNDNSVDASTEANPRASFDFGILPGPTAVNLHQLTTLATDGYMQPLLLAFAIALLLTLFFVGLQAKQKRR